MTIILPSMILLGLIIITGVTKADPEYLFHICPNTTTFSPNSTYQSNLTAVLSTLISSNSTRSSAAVHAQFLCRGDVNSTVCQACVKFAAKDAIKRCPIEQEIMIWYDVCQLRYSNRSFLGSVAERPRVALLNTGEVTEADRERFGRLLNKTMNETVAAAARAGDRFATVEADFNGFQTLYTLAQCTPDLSGANCKACLSDAAARLPFCCLDKLGGRVLFPSCNVRYEFYPFYYTQEDSPATVERKRKISTATVVGIVVPVAGVIAILVVLGLVFCCLRKKGRNSNGKEDSMEFKKGTKGQTRVLCNSASDVLEAETPQFEFATIKAATNKFSSDNQLGGGFGDVYKGTLPNGKQIAVRRLSAVSRTEEAVETFKNEVLLLAKLQDQNILGLLGFCFEGEENLIVYEFMPNKTLDYYIFDSNKQPRLDWSARFNIIRGIARGIVYLHEESQKIIIHRDLNPRNVFLDSDMSPRISKFCFAKILTDDQMLGNTNRIMGTYGYMPPEYAMLGQYSVKSDVYSFGVLVLEVTSGRKNNSFHEADQSTNLVSYAWKLWKEETPLKLLDPTLRDSYSEKEVVQCIHIGLLCVQEDPENRPTMKTIELIFDSDDSVTLPEPEKPAFSESL